MVLSARVKDTTVSPGLRQTYAFRLFWPTLAFVNQHFVNRYWGKSLSLDRLEEGERSVHGIIIAKPVVPFSS